MLRGTIRTPFLRFHCARGYIRQLDRRSGIHRQLRVTGGRNKSFLIDKQHGTVWTGTGAVQYRSQHKHQKTH